MPTQRIRGRKLQAIRKRVLSENPLCVICGRRAVQVDHIKPIFKGGDDDPIDDSNRQGLCAQCHAEKTRRDLGQRPAIGLDGYPIT
jgi:5-methylcytosine-specific restriction endonuclease McrA